MHGRTGEESDFVDVANEDFVFAELVKKRLIYHTLTHGQVGAMVTLDSVHDFFSEQGLSCDFLNPSNLVNINKIKYITESSWGNEAYLENGQKVSISKAMTEKYKHLIKRS